MGSTDNVNLNIQSPGKRGSRVMPSSPWTTIVRGESDGIAATATAIATPSSPLAPSPTAAASTANTEPVALVASPSSSSMVADDDQSSDNGNGSNGNAGKRPAWNKPSNGVLEVGPVMGAVSWPALSESARASGKPSQDSSKGLSDGSSSISVTQGTGSASSSSQKPVTHNVNPNVTPNHTMPARQRSFNKRNTGNSTSNGGVSQPTGSHPQTGEMHSNNSSPRDHSQRNSQSRSTNDHPQQQQQQRNSFRGNGGPHSRDASHHHNYGRRDQDRTNQDWNAHRNFNGRDAHMQPQRVVPRFMRHPPPPPPPPSTSPFMGPPPVRAFGNPIGFHELAPPMYYVAGPPDPLRGVPFVAPIPHAMYFPAPDIQLHSKIVHQIDYYFSNENLIRDTFLRQNMDDQGFVPVKLIAGFNKVSYLTDNIQLILDAIRNSTIVEVQGDKVRRRNDWMRWMMPSVQYPNGPGAPSVVRSSHDMLVASVQSISLEENSNLQSGARSQADVHNEAFLGRASSGDLNSQSQVSSAEGAGQVCVQGVSDSSTSARNSSK
ncbi:la-related protein 1C [Euphorbia lathyris]|uniref:la-related protein 1C n=1 Tax=Euphorbia lathyris TaxID=212925 RepID=UPI003313AF29